MHKQDSETGIGTTITDEPMLQGYNEHTLKQRDINHLGPTPNAPEGAPLGAVAMLGSGLGEFRIDNK